MTANRTSKAADSTETDGAEASVPQQNAGSEKVTVIGKTEDGKRVIVVEDEDTEKTTAVEKFKNLLRNKKVLAGLGTVATIVVIALIRNSGSTTDVEGESGEPSDENPTD
jgi:ABC-type branched-subunit amino acid transport system substrate-binding protein